MIYLFLSIITATISFYMLKHKKKKPQTTVFFYIATLFFLVSNLFFIISNYLTGDGINDAVFFSMQYGLKGSGILEYWKLIIVTAIFLIIGAITPIIFIRKRQSSESNKSLYLIPELLLIISIIVSPGVTKTIAHFAPKEARNDFHQYYVNPEILSKPEHKKNIVYIYSESFERTYFDEEVFPGLVKKLKDIESKSTSFTNINQVYMTGWTIAGTVASQCGIPLIPSGNGNSMSGMDTFLQGATCLGDLLKSQGYKLEFFGGADLEFAGKGKFYSTHGFKPQGLEELKPQLEDPNYLSYWGLYDDITLKIAEKEFNKLSSQEDPFGLFILTLDTHHPNGMPSKSCDNIKYQDGSNTSLNAVACSDYLISGFINSILDSPYADNTLIVLTSDHLALKNQAFDLLSPLERRDMFMIIDPSNLEGKQISKKGTMLDVAPTVLHALGYSADVGLGRNLFTENSIVKKFDIEEFNLILGQWSEAISEFWEFPNISTPITIDPKTETVHIGKRTFETPSLIQIDPDLQTKIIFEYTDEITRPELGQIAKNSDQGVIWVDTCKAVSEIKKNFKFQLKIPDTLCVYIKDPQGKVLYSGKITEDFEIPIEFIKLAAGIYPTENKFTPLTVAHAGGGVNNLTYTNSYLALNTNNQKGFNYFETDFQFTKDDQLVCIHDWEGSFKNYPPTFDEFDTWTKTNGRIKNCTLDGLIQWLKTNPDVKIITDVKEQNLKALKLIAEKFPDFASRIIPQIYDPKNFTAVKNLGYKNIIWTLYRFDGTSQEVIDQAKKFTGNFAITMPPESASTDLPAQLKDLGIPTYVHTINDPAEAAHYIKQQKITNIYTDFLPPL